MQVEGGDETVAVLEQRLGGAAVEGAMLGRSAWKRPWDVLGDADRYVFGAPANAALSRRQVNTLRCQQIVGFIDGIVVRVVSERHHALGHDTRTHFMLTRGISPSSYATVKFLLLCGLVYTAEGSWQLIPCSHLNK